MFISLPSLFAPFIISLCLQFCARSSLMLPCPAPLRQAWLPAILFFPLWGSFVCFVCFVYFITHKKPIIQYWRCFFFIILMNHSIWLKSHTFFFFKLDLNVSSYFFHDLGLKWLFSSHTHFHDGYHFIYSSTLVKWSGLSKPLMKTPSDTHTRAEAVNSTEELNAPRLLHKYPT